MQSLVVIVLAVPALLATAVRGQDTTPTDKDKALQRVEQAIRQEPGLSEETKAAFTDLLDALREQRTAEAASPPQPVGAAAGAQLSKGDVAKAVDEYLEARPPAREKSALDRTMQRLALFGDFRLRLEGDWNRPDGQDDRQRVRLRLRLGANYQITDELLVGGRIVTGSREDSRSSHVTFGDGFEDLEISLDRAFITYRPLSLEGLYLTAGKFNQPIYRNPVYGELVWDADVNPEGFVVGYSFPGGGALERLDLMLGPYILLEDSDADDVWLLAMQATGHFRLAEDLKMTTAVGYDLYGDPVPGGNLRLLNKNAGNAVVDTDGDGMADAFVSDFGILNVIAAVTYTGWRMPLTLSGEYMRNTLANNDRDQGWALGASLGSDQSKGDWRFYYQWQVIEQDAVFSAVAQDDFPLTSNFRGHVFGGNYQFTDNIGLHLWTLVAGSDTSPGQDQWRLRLDLNIKF